MQREAVSSLQHRASRRSTNFVCLVQSDRKSKCTSYAFTDAARRWMSASSAKHATMPTFGRLRRSLQKDDYTRMTLVALRHVNNAVLLQSPLEHCANPGPIAINPVNPEMVSCVTSDCGFNIRLPGHLVLHFVCSQPALQITRGCCDQYIVGDRATLDWLLDHGVHINCTNIRQFRSVVAAR